MGVIRTNAAAAMLGVSPNTLRSWERRFGYPEPRRTAGGHRQFDLAEIEALRSAFEETSNVSSAISLARERGRGPGHRLRACARPSRASTRTRPTGSWRRAWRCARSSARSRRCCCPASRRWTPAATPTGCRPSTASPGAGRPAGWRPRRASRRPPRVPRACVVFDASAPCDVDALHAQALELGLRRRGLRTLTLAVARPIGARAAARTPTASSGRCARCRPARSC